MDPKVLILVLLILLAFGIGVWVIANQFKKGPTAVPTSATRNLRNLVAAQRQSGEQERSSKSELAFAAAAQSELSRKKIEQSAKIDLAKKIKYAHWAIKPKQFLIIQAVVTVLSFLFLCSTPLNWFLRIVFTGIVFFGFNTFLDKAVNKRHLQFDKDYPALLLSYVSLLKTGMSTLTGLDAAAKGMGGDSLVRAEVELMLERIRLGLTEDQAIGSFGEDIFHPEIELFVQSLLLSKKVGGTLSLTLERLARQVRSRQQFKEQAIAAVGMERGSIWAIVLVMTALMLYLSFAAPDLVKPAFTNSLGWNIFQFGLGGVILGILWSRKVTNIKV